MMNRQEAKQTEASLTWMMYECAEEEGAMLLQNYTETDNQTLPGELDEKCRALIEKNFTRQQTQAAVGQIARTFCLALLYLCSLLGIGTVTVMSVESIRQPVMQYVVSITERRLELDGENLQPGLPISVPETSVDVEDPLGQWLPEDYEISTQSGDSIDFFGAIYKNSQGHSIALVGYSLDCRIVWDTEGAQICEEMTFCGHRAFLIVEDSQVSFVWIDERLGVSFGLSADHCSPEEVMDLAEEFITELKEQ